MLHAICLLHCLETSRHSEHGYFYYYDHSKSGRETFFGGNCVVNDLPNHHSFKVYLSVLLISNALVLYSIFTVMCYFL